jgi:peptide/nickel transport system substrate-binding protein
MLSLVLILGTFMGLVAVAEQGPFADSIVFDVRMQEEIAIQDVAAGNSDVFFYAVSGRTISGVDQATLDKLELYVSPGTSYSLPFNPYPNEAPYIATDINDNVQSFNPFAIQAVRFQMHNLVSRRQLVDEILLGAGETAIISVTPSSAGAFKLYLEASKLGITDLGNKDLARTEILKAIEAAAALPAMGNRLVKQNADDAVGKNDGGWWWTFDGQPVTIKFLIRVDDPNIRLPLGQLIAADLETCHIKVERILRNRSFCVPEYQTNPAELRWHMYTEGWGGGGVNRWWEGSIAQYYSGWYSGAYPGWNDPGNYWTFTNPVSEEATKKLIYGQFATLDEYWNLMTTATREGLKDSMRVYLAGQLGYYAVNKAAFESRFLYGLGVGLNWSSEYSMIPVDNTRPVRVTQFSSIGSLFLNPWDPVGTEGFNDLYASTISNCATDMMAQNAMGSAVETGLLCQWKDVKANVDFSGATPVGLIDVPTAATEWNSGTQQWESVGDQSSWAVATYVMDMPKWQDGSEFSLLDFAFAEGFTTNWAVLDSEGDPEFDSGYSATVSPGFAFSHGTVYNWSEGSITAYYDYNHPDLNRLGSSGFPSLWSRSSNFGQGVKYPIYEALGRMVATGTSASGTVYSFTLNPGVVEPDVLTPSCVADIRAELVKMGAEKYVPAYITPLLAAAGKTVDFVVAGYQSAINFIDAYGHAYLSNGGYIITKFDPANNQITVKANRDPSYGFTTQTWYDLFSVGEARINEVTPPFVAVAGQDATITIKADQAIFPFDQFEPGTELGVALIFVGPSGEQSIAATLVAPGEYQAVLPGSMTRGLPAGGYVIVGVATPKDGLAVSLGATLLIQ